MTDSNQMIEGTLNGERSTSAEGNPPITGNGLLKIAIGALVGATLGGLAAALTNRETTEQINQTIRGLGKTAKTTAENLSNSVQSVGDAVNSVAANLSDTTKDVNEAVTSVTTNVSGTVKNTISTVKGTAEGVNETVKTAMNVVNTVKDSVSGIQEVAQTGNAPSEVSNGETLYKLIPVGPDQAAQ